MHHTTLMIIGGVLLVVGVLIVAIGNVLGRLCPNDHDPGRSREPLFRAEAELVRTKCGHDPR